VKVKLNRYVKAIYILLGICSTLQQTWGYVI